MTLLNIVNISIIIIVSIILIVVLGNAAVCCADYGKKRSLKL